MITTSQSRLRARLEESELASFGEDFHEVLFFALGANCQLLMRASRPVAESFRRVAFDWLSQFEAKYSRFLPDSQISHINAAAGERWVEIEREGEVMLDLCAHAHFVTEGAFDATSLPLTLLWDWKRQHDKLPPPEEIAGAKGKMGWPRVQRAPGRVFLPEKGMMLDFGGVGKEFAVDCLKQLAVGHGLEAVLVNLGGDMAVHGDAPEGDGWYIGLEDPADCTRCHCGIRLRRGGAVATSGDYRRCFELNGSTYGHILDCRTGWPVANGTRSVTVLAPRCLVAGLLSTSAMVLGGREAIAMLERAAGVEGCLWMNGQLLETRGFRRSILPADSQAHSVPALS